MHINQLTSLSCEIYSDVRKHPCNSKQETMIMVSCSKPIPQIGSTNYLALFRRSCSLKIPHQTFSVVMGERSPFFPVSAPGLFVRGSPAAQHNQNFYKEAQFSHEIFDTQNRLKQCKKHFLWTFSLQNTKKREGLPAKSKMRPQSAIKHETGHFRNSQPKNMNAKNRDKVEI